VAKRTHNRRHGRADDRSIPAASPTPPAAAAPEAPGAGGPEILRSIEAHLGMVAGTAAGIVALLVYVATLNPTLPPGDSGDLITAAATLGVAHPPGYPLFAIIGHLFTLLPLGSPAFRVNLMSAVLDAAAVGFVAVLIHRVATSDPPAKLSLRDARFIAAAAAVIGALFLAFASEFWSYSLVAEVFALNNFFAAVLLLLAFTWHEDPRRRWALWGFFLASGLAFCNQQTIVLLAPALGTLLIGGILRVRARGGRWMARVFREFAVGIAFLLAGLLPYLYLPLATVWGSPALWGDPSTLERFIRVVTRADYGSLALVAGGNHGTVADNLTAFGRYLLDSFGPAGCLLAVLGLWWLARRQRVVALALVLAFLVAGPLFLAYANPPLSGILAGVFSRFYILPSVPFAVVVGCGAFQLFLWTLAFAERTRRPASVRMRLAAASLVAIALVAMVAGPAAARYPSVDQSANRLTIDFVEDLLAPLEPNAILLTEGDTAILGTWYAQYVENVRPDVTVVAVPLLRGQWYIDELRRLHPDITIPFEAADVADATKSVTDKVLNANLAKRPVYYVGTIAEDFPAGYGEVRTGFSRKFVQKAAAGDPFTFTRANLASLSALRFPTRSYPSTTWENWESTFYGGVAFDLANAYETIDVPTAERWYRRAITLNPGSPGAYKNLAILLSANGGRPSEEADLLDRYLQLAPNDPEAQTIRDAITTLRTTSP
jgi:hypothetical protein